MYNSIFFYRAYRFIGISFIIVPIFNFIGFTQNTIIGILILLSSDIIINQ